MLLQKSSVTKSPKNTNAWQSRIPGCLQVDIRISYIDCFDLCPAKLLQCKKYTVRLWFSPQVLAVSYGNLHLWKISFIQVFHCRINFVGHD